MFFTEPCHHFDPPNGLLRFSLDNRNILIGFVGLSDWDQFPVQFSCFLLYQCLRKLSGNGRKQASSSGSLVGLFLVVHGLGRPTLGHIPICIIYIIYIYTVYTHIITLLKEQANL